MECHGCAGFSLCLLLLQVADQTANSELMTVALRRHLPDGVVASSHFSKHIWTWTWFKNSSQCFVGQRHWSLHFSGRLLFCSVVCTLVWLPTSSSDGLHFVVKSKEFCPPKLYSWEKIKGKKCENLCGKASLMKMLVLFVTKHLALAESSAMACSE